MKRSGPLKRTGGLKRSPLKSKPKPVKSDLYQQVLARDGNCMGRELPGACFGRIDPHHIKMRSQGGLDTLDNLISLCRAHHSWVHEHPEESYELGFLKHGWEK